MKPVSVLLFVIAIAIVSCSKEEIPQEVKIQYELLDDVSPVKVKLRVDGNFHWAEWKYNGYINDYPEGDNKGMSEYVFQPQEVAIVNFTGSSVTGEKCIGRLAFQTPPVATKVVFTGISATNLSDYFPITTGKYKLDFSLQDPYPKFHQSVTIDLNNPLAERLDFPIPVEFHIPHFYENAEHAVSLYITRENESQPVFSTNIFLKQTYLHDRIYYGKTQIGFKIPSMFLETDWKP